MESRLIDLEKKVAGQEVLLTRVDTALDKISEVSINVSKLLAVHEQRIESQEEASKKLDNRADDLHSRVSSSEQRLRNEMSEGQKEILNKIDGVREDIVELGDDLIQKTENIKTEIEAKVESVSARVTKLERMAYYVIGGAAVIGFLIAQVMGLFNGYFSSGHG